MGFGAGKCHSQGYLGKPDSRHTMTSEFKSVNPECVSKKLPQII